MTDLSPTASAVMIAATNGNFNLVDDPVYKQCIAAALRAAADQVVPEQLEEPTGSGFRWGVWAAKSGVRAKLLAIAAELKATND